MTLMASQQVVTRMTVLLRSDILRLYERQLMPAHDSNISIHRVLSKGTTQTNPTPGFVNIFEANSECANDYERS